MTAARAALLAAGVALGGAALVGGAALRALSPVDGSAAVVVLEVPSGASLPRIARQLEEAGVVRSARAFELLARWRGLASELRSGEYELSPALGTGDLLDQIAQGRVRTHRVALPEGLTAVEVAARLEAQGLVDAEAFLHVVRSAETARTLGVEGEGLEGYLFPETYHLARGLDALEIAGAMVAQFLDVWREIAAEATERGLGMEQVVTLASLVEKETAVPDERPLVAGVFHNRLQRGMRLETDPSVIYGIPDFDGNLRRAHLEDEANPYNTYRIPGLPPSPIANPGAESLRAVVRPAETEHLYFVSRNDGSHVFSRTYREHLAAVRRYQKPAARRDASTRR